MRLVRGLILCLGFWLCLGCAPTSITDSLSPAAPTTPFAPQAGLIGQSFVARHAGLQQIAVYLSTPDSSGAGRLTLHLRDSSLSSAKDIRTIETTLLVLAAPQWLAFDFPAIVGSHNQSYYFFIDGDLARNAKLYVAPLSGDAYRDGAMYLNHQAQDAQLPVQLSYAADVIAFDLLGWLLHAAQTSLVMLVVFIAPGLALQTFLLPLSAWNQRIALAAGLSLSLYPLIMLWASVVGVRLGSLTVWIPVTMAIVALVWRGFKAARAIEWHVHKLPRFSLVAYLPELTWLAVVTLIICVRLFVLRGVDEPMWGDSVQHTVIAQLILDHGGLFESWQPYAPYSTLTVHYGFHAAVAAVAWFTGESALNATLLTGQMVNILAIITLSLIAARLTTNRWAGVGVLVVAGLLSPLPQGYVNWGRYPQLTGQAIMPVAVWWLWQSSEMTPVCRMRQAALGALLFAGTFLGYYRMPYYVAAFVLAFGIIYGIQWLRQVRTRWLSPLFLWIVAGVSSVGLLLPWLLRLRGGTLAGGVEAGLSLGSPLESVINEYQIFLNLESYVPILLVVAAVLVAAWALLRRHAALSVMVLWSIAIVLLPASRLLRVPGAANLQGFAIVISLYIPMGLLVGYGIDACLGRLSCLSNSTGIRHARFGLALVLAFLGVIAIVGTRDRLRIVDQSYRILAPADVRAMEWIRSNVPPAALFLVDGFLIYNGTSVVGSDGGWYIPLLTQRSNTMPPQYALLSERPMDASYNKWVVDLMIALRRVGVTSTAGVALLCLNHITHVYVGQEQGSNGSPPPQPLLSIGMLAQSPAFTMLYRQDRVGVFALNEAACH
jgi:hypothetical protein